MGPQLQHRFYDFEYFRVDVRRRLLLRQGKPVSLTPKAFDILLVLIQNHGRVIGKDELMRLVWPETTVEENNLTRNISSLRKALDERPTEHRYIVTVPGRGYRFAAEPSPQMDGTEILYERHARARVLIEEESENDAATQPVTSIETGVVERRSWRSIVTRLTLAAITCALLGFSSWRYLSLREGALLPAPRIVPLTSVPDRAECSSLSPDGNRLAFSRHSDSPGLSGIYIKQIGSDSYLQVTRGANDWCPEWSPDSRYLAFSRYGYQQHSVYLVSTLGGEERKLYSGAPAAAPLDWSPDGKLIAFSAANLQSGSYSVLTLAVETLETHRLTEPPAGYQDWDPVFSPDGSQMAFIRTNGKLTAAEVYLMSANGGRIRRLTFDDVWIPSRPAWMPSGQSILFSSTRRGLPTLWRIPVSGGSPVQVSQAGVKAFHPTVSLHGDRLAFDQELSNSSLWRLDLAYFGKADFRRQVTASKGRNTSAELSPDGLKIVFVSDRSGSDEIYVCNADGSNLLQLTNLRNARKPGRPRWSPDGQRIAFDSVTNGRTVIFVSQANGGEPSPLTDQSSDNLNPTWSHDGQWIYFASNRTGLWQIWKMRSQGGDAFQLTREGGFVGFESSDGRFIYYAKTAADPDIWRLQLEDRQEVAVSPQVHVSQWTSWALVDKGIFFVREGAEAHPVLRYLDFATSRVKDMAPLEKQPWPLWISASPDAKSILYQQVDMLVSNVMLVENFR
jgi:Tol biopolymer transport system component/DNA-binding winged helix-turn-helix (wHTH) protein